MVCDDLVQHGGHEHIIMEFARLYPGAPLYTTAATQNWQQICREKGIDLRTSWMKKLPFLKQLNRVYAVFLFHILALESFNFDDFDVVVSLSSRFSHGVITKPGILHICYMSTVGRMFWEPHGYFSRESLGGWGILKKIQNLPLQLSLAHIRLWDQLAAQRPDVFATISETTRQRIKKYYQRDARIIYPPVDVRKYSAQTKKLPNDYFLVVTRLNAWKRVDLAIEACLKCGFKLKIIGEGPDRPALEKIAGGSKLIEFLGYVTEEEKIKYLQNCLALVMTQYEDFGLVPIEAMAGGKPTIAYKKGGVLETVQVGVTGEFYDEQTIVSLQAALKNFKPQKYDPISCLNRAKLFDVEVFNKAMSSFIEDKHLKHSGQ